jgi:hypothetical protein
MNIETIIIEHLQVWPEDLGEMTWDEATARVAKLGPGWRLPTIREFEDVLYPNMKKIPKISKAFYWSSTEYDDDYTWSFLFLDGNTYYYTKYTTSYVRPVRDFTGEVALDLLLKEF